MTTRENEQKYVLITGGMGYIGVHLLQHMYDHHNKIVVVDIKSSEAAREVIRQITGNNESESFIKYINLDISNEDGMIRVFKQFDIYKVFHLAALKSVRESVKNPDLYFRNNVGGTEVLLKVMKKFGVKEIVFSSSASIYDPSDEPVKESSPVGNGCCPYARTKLECERIINETASKGWKVTILRYFNPIGWTSKAEKFNTGGNLMEALIESIKEQRPFCIYGRDYGTPDGTPIRDYIFIDDLITAHSISACGIFNVGSGTKTSVKEIVSNFDVDCIMADRREGDTSMYFADIKKISEYWRPAFGISDISQNINMLSEGHPNK